MGLGQTDSRGQTKKFHTRPKTSRWVSKNAKGTAVSIHAPARGATIRPAKPLLCKAVSIHAPAWGATFDILITS